MSLLTVLAPIVMIAAITLTTTYSDRFLKNRIIEMKKLADISIGNHLNVNSVGDAISIMESMNYYPDTLDYTKIPQETLKVGGGDCEDLAVLSYSLLMHLYNNGRIRYEPNIAIAYDDFNQEAHAFTYFYCPRCNEYYIFSNNIVFRAASPEEAAKMLGYSKVIKGEEVIGLW